MLYSSLPRYISLSFKLPKSMRKTTSTCLTETVCIGGAEKVRFHNFVNICRVIMFGLFTFCLVTGFKSLGVNESPHFLAVRTTAYFQSF